MTAQPSLNIDLNALRTQGIVLELEEQANALRTRCGQMRGQMVILEAQNRQLQADVETAKKAAVAADMLACARGPAIAAGE